MSDVDWEKEGLLEGVEGDERDARVDLLEQLHDDGVELDELKKAVEEERLTLLPVERVIGSEHKYTPQDIADKAGVDLEMTQQQWQALGLPHVEPDDKRLGERDLEAAKQLKAFIDAGLPVKGIMGVARVMGEGMSRTVDAVLHLAAEAFLEQGITERDLGLRYAEAAKQLIPLMEEQLDYVFNLHMREGIRADVVTATERVDRAHPRVARMWPSASRTWSGSPSSARTWIRRTSAAWPASWPRWRRRSPRARSGWSRRSAMRRCSWPRRSLRR